ncbi:MAG: zf-HC2 domain-containing protein [Candidatus Sulfotelmatobacter sp.]
MDHEVVVRRKVTESYLLGELDPDAREEFEAHFFECPDCALDVRTGSLFVEQSKILLAEKSGPVAVDSRRSLPAISRAGWWGWLRPALIVPVMALLLVVVGYQNLVTYPHLQQAMNRPQVLPFASVNLGTYGAGDQVISVGPEQGFLLMVRIPPDNYPRHMADLYNSAGKLEWSLTFPSSSTATQDEWPLQVPGAKRAAGSYSLIVHGLTDTGESKEVGRASFELQIQK